MRELLQKRRAAGSLGRWISYPLLLAGLWVWLGPSPLSAGPDNGFDLFNALVPAEQIEHGGPGRDGIPAISQPRFASAAQAGFLGSDDRVLGINLHGEQKAYPVRILNYHEIVNDRFGEEAVAVTLLGGPVGVGHAAEGAIGADDAVTRDDERDGILPVRRADGEPLAPPLAAVSFALPIIWLVYGIGIGLFSSPN